MHQLDAEPGSTFHVQEGCSLHRDPLNAIIEVVTNLHGSGWEEESRNCFMCSGRQDKLFEGAARVKFHLECAPVYAQSAAGSKFRVCSVKS